MRVPIPSQLRDGKLLVRVCDADSALASEISRKPESFVPRSLDHLISILGTERPHDAFYVQLIRKREGRLVNGLEYPNLPFADLNNDGLTNTLDFGLFKQAFGSSGQNLDADFDGNGVVNTLDFGLFKQMFGKPPGPSGLVP